MEEKQKPDMPPLLLLQCPHCGQNLKKWKTPPQTSWDAEFQYVCFNDDCPYFKRGWQWMLSQYNVIASYRHRYNPETGESGPLPIWSKAAMKDAIVPDSE